MGKAKISEKKVAELAEKSGLSAERAREALEKHGGEVDPTLEKLIDSGDVKLTMLNPKLVSPMMFVRAQVNRATQAMKESGMGSGFGDAGPLMEMYAQFLGNAKPDKKVIPALEQLVESEKRREKVEKSGPLKIEM